MICSSCMRRLSSTYKLSPPTHSARAVPFFPPSLRTFTTSTACRISPAESTAPAPHQGSPSDSRHPPAATSTSAAQPFSTPRTPRPARMSPTSSQGDAPPVVSSVPAGTPLKGLSYMKNKPDPVALEDWEYPPWLWTLLQPKGGQGANAIDDADLYSKSKKQRRAAAKRLRNEEKNKIYKEKEVPLYEQTIDLPASDGTLEGATNADAAREDLTKAMRQKRRADIKESNFLKTM